MINNKRNAHKRDKPISFEEFEQKGKEFTFKTAGNGVVYTYLEGLSVRLICMSKDTELPASMHRFIWDVINEIDIVANKLL